MTSLNDRASNIQRRVSRAKDRVLGLTTEIVDMLPFRPPVMLRGVLLPWRDRIICDGLVASYNIMFGGGARRMYRWIYKEAKARGIVTCLDPTVPAPPPKPEPRKPKSPAIARFSKRCPRAVAEPAWVRLLGQDGGDGDRLPGRVQGHEGSNRVER